MTSLAAEATAETLRDEIASRLINARTRTSGSPTASRKPTWSTSTHR